MVHLQLNWIPDRVRDAYFLADPDDLLKSYLRYIDYLNVKSSPVNYSMDEIRNCKYLLWK